jgi:hypothetical protein
MRECRLSGAQEEGDATVTLRQGRKPHGFFGLSSVVGPLRSVPWGRLGERRSGGGKARHEHPHSDLHDQAVPCPLLFPCLVQRDEWPTACSWHPGEKQHPRLSTLSPWERTHTGGGFPCAIVVRTTLPKPVDKGTRGFVVPNSSYSGSTRKCFYRWPFTSEPVHFSVVQGTMGIFSQRSTKVAMYQRVAQAKNA